MNKKPFELNALVLHLTAMAAMLLDHMWATVTPGNLWMNCVGRIAFPIFAFLIVEGYFHTRDIRRYLLRLLLLALLSEIPFNLMNGGSIIYPYGQNVIWTFLIALLCICGMERARESGSRGKWVLASLGYTLLGLLAGLLLMTDYNAAGVLMVLVFYFFRGRRWYHFAGQLLALYWINAVVIMGMDLPFSIFGHRFFFPTQGFALFALLPIWLYRGKQGPHNRAIQYACYAFYPVHILLLSLLALYG